VLRSSTASKTGSAAPTPLVTAGKPERSAPCRLRDTKVLLAIGEGLAKDLLFMLVSDKCAEVREAASAARALELFRKHKFDFVIVDEGLPDLDRARFLACIRQGDPQAAVALIGAKLDGGASDPADIRADALIGFPLDMDRLSMVFCKAVNGRKGRK